MKNKKLIFSAITGFVFAVCITYAQTDVLKEANEYLSLNSGGTFFSPKGIKGDDPRALPYIALKFRSASTGTAQTGFGKNVVRSAAYAVLDGIDSAMCQTITNEFYKIFVDKLKSAGFTMAEMEKIKASKRYQEFAAKQLQRNYSHKETGAAHIYTENNDPLFEQPGGMKLYKFINEVEAGLIFLRLTVDFVEFDMSMQDRYTGSGTMTNASANIRTTIKISSTFGETMGEAFAGGTGGLSVYNKKMETVLFTSVKPIYAPYQAEAKAYDEKVPEYAQNHRLFGGGAMQLGTFVVKPDPEAYHKAAIEGLTRYADYVAAIIKSYNEKK